MAALLPDCGGEGTEEESALDPPAREWGRVTREKLVRRTEPAPVVPEADALAPDDTLVTLSALDAALAADDVMLAARLDTSLPRLADRLSSDESTEADALSSAPADVTVAADEMTDAASDEAVARTDEADDSRPATVEAADSVTAAGRYRRQCGVLRDRHGGRGDAQAAVVEPAHTWARRA